MITRHRLHDITTELSREYANHDGQDYTIEHALAHGSAIVVCFTCTYKSSADSWTESRVATFRRDDSGTMRKHTDIIADSYTRAQ